MKIPRLFVPLSSTPFRWYSERNKNIELRKYRRQYTTKNVYPGRIVELRKGYSGKTPSIWGAVTSVRIYPNIESALNDKRYSQIFPDANSYIDALSEANGFYKLNDSFPFIAFSMLLLDKAQFIEFQDAFLDGLLHGKKITTIRQNHRDYKPGYCIIYSNKRSMLAEITAVEHTEIHELTDDDAKKDGFADRVELLSVLHDIYPTIYENKDVTIVRLRPVLLEEENNEN